MNVGEVMVVGVKHGHKEGSETTVVFYNTVFEQFEVNNKDYVCIGLSSGSEYFRKHIDVKPGDLISINYRKNSFSGKAMADSINLLKPGK